MRRVISDERIIKNCRLDLFYDAVCKKCLELRTYRESVESHTHRLVVPIWRCNVRTRYLPRGSGRENNGVFIELRRNERDAGGGRISLEVFPRRDENVGSLTLAESRELDGGWTDGRTEGRERAPSGNLRGIEDLVHSYPPTSRPLPAESSLSLNAPIPFP